MIVFGFIAIYLLRICIWGEYIADVLFSRALPLSILSVAISIVFLATKNKN